MHDLRCEECAGQLGRKELARYYSPQEPIQIGDCNVGTSIRRSDRWEGVDVLFPAHYMPCCVASRVASFGDVMVDAVHPQEVGGRHLRFGEHVGADVIAVGHPADGFDQESQEDVAAVAIAAPLPWGEVGRLVDELGQEVAGFDDGVVGLRLPQVFVAFPASSSASSPMPDVWVSK